MAAVAHAVPHLRAGGARLVHRARGAAARTTLKPERHPLLPLLVRLRLPPKHLVRVRVRARLRVRLGRGPSWLRLGLGLGLG